MAGDTGVGDDMPVRGNKMRRARDVEVIKRCISALDLSSDRKMLAANLDYLVDRYIGHPSHELPEHLRPFPIEYKYHDIHGKLVATILNRSAK